MQIPTKHLVIIITVVPILLWLLTCYIVEFFKKSKKQKYFQKFIFSRGIFKKISFSLGKKILPLVLKMEVSNCFFRLRIWNKQKPIVNQFDCYIMRHYGTFLIEKVQYDPLCIQQFYTFDNYDLIYVKSTAAECFSIVG